MLSGTTAGPYATFGVNVPTSGTYEVDVYQLNWQASRSVTQVTVGVVDPTVPIAIFPVGTPAPTVAGRPLVTTLTKWLPAGQDTVQVPVLYYAALVVAPMTPPAAPSNLVVTVQSSSSIGLSWTDSASDETGFSVERQVAGSSTWTLVTTTGAGVTSYTDTTVQASTEYSYRVSAENAAGSSGDSSVVSGTTPATAAPAAPTNLAVTVQSDFSIQLSWTDNSTNETGFVIERQASGGSWTVLTTTAAGATSFTDSTVSAYGQYSYRVSATNSVGNSAPSNVVAGTAETWALDANGFTVLTPSADTTIIYVSSSTGNDANNGLTPATPVATVTHAVSLCPSGHPAWILLKCGDTFPMLGNDLIGNAGFPLPSGTSTTAMSLLGSYGTGDRPLITGPLDSTATGLALRGLSNIAIVRLNFYNSTAETFVARLRRVYRRFQGISDTNFSENVQNILIEDCVVNFFSDNIDMPLMGSGSMTNFVIRRNIITNSYSTESPSEGIFTSGETNMLIEENVIDHNGWLGSRDNATTGADIYNHDIYLSAAGSGFVIQDNIIADASSYGMEDRCGGVVQNNLFIDDPLAVAVGLDPDYAMENGYPTGQTGTVTGNVILDGNDINPSTPRGEGIEVDGTTIGVTVTNNLVAHMISAAPNSNGYQSAIALGGQNSIVENNTIFDWNAANFPTGIQDGGTGDNVANNTVDGTGYLDTTRDPGKYNGTLGGAATNAAFLALVESRPAGTWDSRYTTVAVNNYILAGFGLPSETEAQ